MKTRWNRRGQFYLIAALAMISIIIGIATITNKSEVKESSKIIYDWKEELDIESSYVLDYLATNEGDKDEVLENFTRIFSNYSTETEFYFIYGEEEDLNAYKYFDGLREDVSQQMEISDEKIKINIDETEYEFPLTQGENFYYVIYKKEGDDKYVATS